MPGIDGGSSSDREYAPHMYVLIEGGDPNKDADYAFVGDTVVSVEAEEMTEYRMGVTVLGKIVCDMSVYDHVQCVPTGIAFESIPQSVRTAMIDEGLSQVATVSGQIILGVLGIEVPQDVEPLDFDKLLSGSAEEQAAERVKSEQWETIEQQLRASLWSD